MRVLKESAHFNDVSVDTTCAKVSIVGAGMQSHSGVASKMFEALSNNNINIKMISTSEIKISCIIDRADATRLSAPSTICCLTDLRKIFNCGLSAPCRGRAGHNFLHTAAFTQIAKGCII